LYGFPGARIELLDLSRVRKPQLAFHSARILLLPYMNLANEPKGMEEIE